MYCVNHEAVESVTLCHACGKAICAQCQHDVKGVNYCPDCLAKAVEQPRVEPPRAKSPGLAAVLAFVPGLGAIYNGQYVKAVAFIAVFAGLIHAIDRARGTEEPFAGLLMAGFWFYMIFDSVRSARAINQAAASEGAAPAAAVASINGKESLGWGIAITVLGVVFQLWNLDLIKLSSVLKLWPVILIVIAVGMLKNYFTASGAGSKEREEEKKDV
ncbi:MAG: DUF5668 domain-containing protein [Acidobacteriota bacterium]